MLTGLLEDEEGPLVVMGDDDRGLIKPPMKLD